ncbi:MAG TPA: hypothetical protein PLF84_16530 [Bryobacteraceae bacterium]|nr:hypothetical protein [Bryobacteraceae bacterium]
MLARTLLLVLLCALAAAAQFRAGAAARIITPDLGQAKAYLAGFGQNRAATGVHDDLHARCLALAVGATPSVVLCGVDSIGLFFDDVQAIRKAVSAKHPAPVNVIVAVTHSHETPDTMGLWGPQIGVSGVNPAYNRLVLDRTAEAALAALAALQPATARLAKASSPRLREFYDDSRPPFVLDDEILALAVDHAQTRKPIAILVNWASHPEALGSNNTLVTADWCHYLYSEIESATGAAPVFLNGALGGMMSPLGATVTDHQTGKPAPKDTFRFAEIVGREAARHVLQALATAEPATPDSLGYREALASIPVTNRNFLMAAAAGLFQGRKQMTAAQGTTAPVGYLRLSRAGAPLLEAAAIPGELYPELSVGPIARDPNADFPDAPFEPVIKRDLFKAPFRMVFGLANDEIGYIIPKAQWDEKSPYTFGAAKPWYGEINAPGPDTAPIILKTLSELVAADRP